MRSRLSRKLPLYAAAAIAAGLVATVADAREWSTGELFIALVIAVPLYVGLVAIPVLMRERALRDRMTDQWLTVRVGVVSRRNGSPTFSVPSRTAAGPTVTPREPAETVP
jgi:hypothetical protein